jgi:recombination protein RecA
MSSQDWVNMVKKDLGDAVYTGTVDIKAWDSGVYSLNRGLGGGWASGRMHLLVGKESTGKSTLTSKAAATVNKVIAKDGKIGCPLTDKTCNVLYLDAEGTLDKQWCEAHGYHPDANGNVVMSTDTGDQLIDVTTSAIQSRQFSLIVVDSTEALVPSRDLEKSSEDALMGTKAKMMNKAYRTWQVAMNEACRNADSWQTRPTLLVINQLRDTIGGFMPMPPTIPGGIGQRQFSTSIVQMNSPKYSEDGKEPTKGTFKGVVKKNKVGTPRMGFEFEMGLSGLGDLATGEVDNVRGILKDIRSRKLWTPAEKGGWNLFGDVLPKQGDFEAKMRSEPDYELEVMQKTVEAMSKNG